MGRRGDKPRRSTVVCETGFICEVLKVRKVSRGTPESGDSKLSLELEHDGWAGGHAGDGVLWVFDDILQVLVGGTVVKISFYATSHTGLPLTFRSQGQVDPEK